MPIAGMIARDELMTWGPGAHGSTYGGNPVACAALIETVRLLESELVENARYRGAQARTGLEAIMARHPETIRDVRGLGLMIGVEFDSPETADAIQTACFQKGLLVLEAGEGAIRLSPALVVSEEQIDIAVRIFAEAVAEVETARG
jgi:4-aminobutyrate aminotransferase